MKVSLHQHRELRNGASGLLTCIMGQAGRSHAISGHQQVAARAKNVRRGPCRLRQLLVYPEDGARGYIAVLQTNEIRAFCHASKQTKSGLSVMQAKIRTAPPQGWNRLDRSVMATHDIRRPIQGIECDTEAATFVFGHDDWFFLQSRP